MRSRLLDLAVATVCVAFVTAPMLASGVAATNPAVVESGGTVDQRVKQAGWISNPIGLTFESGACGKLDGSVTWSQFTTGRNGAKLSVSADSKPAMDGIDDYSTNPSGWNVSGGEKRFGFTASGAISLSRFDDGTKWRGFEGRRAVEVARRGTAFSAARTTIKLRAECGGSGPRPTANIRGTAVPNL